MCKISTLKLIIKYSFQNIYLTLGHFICFDVIFALSSILIIMNTKFGNIDLNDFLHGLITAMIASLVTGVYQLLQTSAALDWTTLKPVVIAGVGAGLAYVLKNLFQNSNGQFAQPEPTSNEVAK